MKFSEEIINVFDYLGEKMGIAIDWTSSNVMPYLQNLCERYIDWEIATSTTWIVICIVAIIVSAIIFKCADWNGGEKFIFFVTLFIGVWVIGEQIFDIVKCNFLPELQIYEYITSLTTTT